MLPSRGYFSSISCPFLISGNCDRPHCHYRHCKTPTKEYDDEEPIRKRLFRIQARLSHEIKTHYEEEKIRTEKESQQNYGGMIPRYGPSGYPPTNMPANRPSNGDYYKRHIPVVYAPAKPTVVRRNSQYIPSVPQNCARPSNVNYTPSSRPVSNPASEYKPQSLSSEFHSSVSYKPSQTIRHHAYASSYTPRQTGKSDSSVSYTPSTGKTNLDAYYTPSQTGKTYPSASYSPSPTLTTNSDAFYAPQGVSNVMASYSPTLSRNSDTNSRVSYTPSLRRNSEASYSPSDMIGGFDSSYSPASSITSPYALRASDVGARLMDPNYGQKVKNIVDAQTSPINSPKRADSLEDISSIKPKTTSMKETNLLTSRELSPELDDGTPILSDDEIEDDEDEEDLMDSMDVEMQVENVSNLEESKHSKEKKSPKEIPDKKKDILIEKAKKESRREHDKNLSKEKKEEASDHSKKKSKSSSESKEKSSSHAKNKEGKSKSDSKDSKTTECKEHKHSNSSEKTKSSEKKIKSESSKDEKTKDSSSTSKIDKNVGHSSSSSKNEKRKHSSSKDDKTKEADSSSKGDKVKTNGHSKSSHGSHSKSSSKSSHSKSEERKNASSSEKPHKPTEKKHSSSSSSSSKHRHSSSKSESSRSKHSSSTKEKSKESSSRKRSSSAEDNLKVKKPKLEDHIIMEEDSDDDNQGQVICLDSEDDGCDDIGFISNHKEEEVVRTTVGASVSVENTSVDRWVKARETINRNSQGRVRIAHVPNVSSLLSAKEMIMSRNSNKRGNTSEPEAGTSSDYVEPKVSKRVAHTPKVDDSLKYPTVKPHQEVKINLFTRQTCLRNVFEEFAKHIRQEDATRMAIKEELEIAKKVNFSKTYQNSVAQLVLKIRKNKGIIDKNTGPVVEILSSNSIPSFTYGHTLYECCLKYLVSDKDLKRNGFPLKIKGRPGYAYFDTTLSNRFPEKQEGSERVCINCNTIYMVDDDEIPIMNNECCFHWGRAFKSKVGGNWIDYYSCCNRDMMMSGCEIAAFHLSNTFDWNALEGFVSTSPPPSYIPDDDCGVFALDCEMCYTTRGSELTRCTVIDLNGKIVYDAIVRPDNIILDYCTRFSGITEEIMRKSRTKLADVQARLLDLFNSKTILVGHSLENDLKALRLFHDRIIDTSILFPHKQGFPYKRALRTLTKEFLGREIQVSDDGHDSKEDAVACLDLLMLKIREDSKVRKPRVIISLPS